MQAAGDLVNTLGHPSGNEYMGTPELARQFLVEHSFSDVEAVSEDDVAEMHAVRSRLEDVFYAPDERTATSLINRLLEEYDVKPYLTNHDGRWHFHYAPESSTLGRRVASDLVMGLAALIAEYGFDRFGICAADNCGDVFVDMSRNKSRRYCNEVCSSRTNVAAHRRRARATSS